jgi:hypothetical protein
MNSRARSPKSPVLRDPRPRAAAGERALVAAERGRLIAIDDVGRPFVSVEGARKPVEARVDARIHSGDLRDALESGQEVILVFEKGDLRKPIIIGLLWSPDRPPRAPDPKMRELAVIEADVDGRRVRLVAKDEIVLECGKASITMRRNGKVIVRGTHVETNSEGTNRIKGGQVKIN